MGLKRSWVKRTSRSTFSQVLIDLTTPDCMAFSLERKYPLRIFRPLPVGRMDGMFYRLHSRCSTWGMIRMTIRSPTIRISKQTTAVTLHQKVTTILRVQVTVMTTIVSTQTSPIQTSKKREKRARKQQKGEQSKVNVKKVKEKVKEEKVKEKVKEEKKKRRNDDEDDSRKKKKMKETKSPKK